MKIQKSLVCLSVSIWFALVAGLPLVPAVRAQSMTPRVPNRVLFIFDTSSAMKRRLPAEDKSINQLFAITLNGALRPGDTIGVWTFSQDLHMGEFPLQEWSDDNVTVIPDEIIGFLKKQHYSKQTSFDELMRTLNRVVQVSPRLTTFIFCDGKGELKDFSGADTINADFKKHYHDMEKARVPFVIVLRSQFGQNGVGHFVGCTINSAASISIPQFPPMPLPPQPAPVAAPAPPPPPPTAPPLIVIGTNSSTNLPPVLPPPAVQQQRPAPKLPPQTSTVPTVLVPAVTPPPAPAPLQQQTASTLPPQATSVPVASVPPAAPPAPVIAATITNSAPPPIASIESTNPIVPPVQGTARPIPPVAATVAPLENTSLSKDGLIATVAGLVVVAGGALVLISRRSGGRHSASLITESLKKR